MGEVAEKTGSGGTPPSSDPRYYGGSIPFLGIGDIAGRFVDTTQKTLTEEGLANSTAWVVPQGAISLAMYASYGKSAILSRPMATSQAFFNVVFSSDATRDFIYSRFQCAEVRHEWDAMVSTGTQPNLSGGKLKKWEVSLPQQPEQRLIGRFFSTLDSLIAAAERQEDLLRQKKQAYLQLMFPREGETEPRLRFAGFSGEWEQRQLGEVVEVVGGGTPDSSNPRYWDGDIDWYTPSEIGGHRYVDESVRKITHEGLNNSSAKLLPKGSILFTSRASIGLMAFIRRPSSTNQGFQSLVPSKLVDPDFLFAFGPFITRYAKTHAAGSTFIEISGKSLGKTPLALPTIPEQRLIGQFFNTLDSLIAAAEKRTKHLHALKGSYLQRMFA